VIGRLHHLIVDAAEPRQCAEFWSWLLGEPITYDDGSFVVVSRDEETSGMAFQRAPDHVPPTWPSPGVPQQMHVDVMVEDPEGAGPDVIEHGARHLAGDTYADPAGHPFCLIKRPEWAARL
jgi:hypothetical protein